METHEIQDQVNALVDAGMIEKSDAKQAVKVLKSVWTDKIAIVWGADDVVARSIDIGHEITKAEAIDVLERSLENFDANSGVSWDTIDDIIFGILKDKV